MTTKGLIEALEVHDPDARVFVQTDTEVYIHINGFVVDPDDEMFGLLVGDDVNICDGCGCDCRDEPQP